MPTKLVKRSDGREELIASQALNLVAHPVDIRYLKNWVAAGRGRSVNPWAWYEKIGAVQSGITRCAKIAGYAKIQAREIGKDGKPGKVATTGLAAEVAAMFGSPYGGQRGLVDRFFTLMKVPGDAYLIRCRENADGTGDVTGYDVLGAREIDLASLTGIDERSVRPNEPIRRITMPASSGTGGDNAYRIIQPQDFLGRIWRPSAEYVELATSPITALDTECMVLHLLTLGLKGKLLSRLALNGILYLPSEINDVRSGTPTGQENEVLDNKTFDHLIKAASWAIQNFEDPRSALPIFAQGPAQFADAIRHIVLDREVYQTDMDLRAEMIDHILTGLDINKVNTKGDGKQAHMTAWAQTDDEMRVNVKPELETLSWAATRLVLNRVMMEEGKSDRTAGKYMLWFDLSDAQNNVNLAEDARQNVDRILINDTAARKATGFDESDAPVGDEIVRAVGKKMNIPVLALWGLPEWQMIEDKVGWANVGSKTPGPNPQSPGDTPQSNPGNQPGKGPGGRSESDTPKRLKPAV